LSAPRQTSAAAAPGGKSLVLASERPGIRLLAADRSLRRALLMSRGDPTVFVTRPISCVILIVAVAALVAALIPTIRSKREEAFQE